MKYAHLAWPFFGPTHREFASELDRWVSVHLGEFEQDEGNDGRAARKIFELLARSGWLKQTLPAPAAPHDPAKIDLRSVCLLREISAYSSAIADVALSEPWLGILPIALYGSPALRNFTFRNTCPAICCRLLRFPSRTQDRMQVPSRHQRIWMAIIKSSTAARPGLPIPDWPTSMWFSRGWWAEAMTAEFRRSPSTATPKGCCSNKGSRCRHRTPWEPGP